MIRVLHIGMSSNPGGVERLVLNYHRNIDREEIQFNYLDMYGGGIAFSEEIKLLGSRIHSISNYKKYPLRAAKQLRSILKKESYDIVHIHMQSAANIMPIVVAIQTNIPVIAHCHSSSTPKGILRKILNRLNLIWLRKQNVFKWACGRRAGKWMWGEAFNENNIIPNAIDYEAYKYDKDTRKNLREELGFNEEQRIIGFVGRFGDEKNIFFLVDILKELLKLSHDYKLVTVGGNDLYDEFVEKIKKENLIEYYYSAGIQKSTSEWYQIMDAFLLPSFFEGFPMVGVEAQAAGLPCFFSDRISDEIGLTSAARFLTIDKNSEGLWAKEIDDRLTNYDRDLHHISEIYIIRNAAILLSGKYKEIVRDNR